MANIYDHEQLIYDLTRIVTFLGERKQHGFFTLGHYSNDSLEIVDPYVERPVLSFDGVDIDLHEVHVDSVLGEKILKLALMIEGI